MRFFDFANELMRRGASMEDVRRLDREGRQSADDAHCEMCELGEMPDLKDENDFKSFCAHIGREFVLENIETIFEIKKEG